MKFTRLHTIGIIALVLLSLSGLSFVQFSWLQGAKAIQEAKVQDRLNQAMDDLEITFNSQFQEKKYFSSSCEHGLSVDSDLLISDTERMVDSVLRSKSLAMPFAYGYLTCKSKDFSWFSDPMLEEEIRKGCEMKIDSYNFTTSKGQDHLHFYVTFPKQDQLIFRKMSLAIGSSILFILLLMAAIGYMLYTIFRQKKLSEMKNDFINNLTHEFKTPIASIALAAKTMKRLDDVNHSGKAMSYLNLIGQEGKRLENHIDKVLQMATLDSGSFALDKTEVNVHDTIRKVTESLSVILEKQDGVIDMDLKAYHPHIQADSMHLFNMIYNIVDNAIKYNNGKPYIHIESETHFNNLHIMISDNGIGMSKEVQKQIFDRFYRQKTGDIHDVKGFGLGLAYVKRMMDAHGGRIELDSQKGRGTTFSLVFPVK